MARRSGYDSGFRMSQNRSPLPAASPPPRRYDKGERRHKHVSRSSSPEFQYDRGNPKRIIGKCPNNLTPADCEAILGRAIPVPNGDRSLVPHKRLYAFHDGTIYECRTSDHGMTYHGFPLRGRMPRWAADALRASLKSDVECSALDAWIDGNIDLEG